MKRKTSSAAAQPVLALPALAVANSPSVNRPARVAPNANAVARVPARSPDQGRLRHLDPSLFRRPSADRKPGELHEVSDAHADAIDKSPKQAQCRRTLPGAVGGCQRVRGSCPGTGAAASLSRPSHDERSP